MQAVIAVNLKHVVYKEHELMSRKWEQRKGPGFCFWPSHQFHFWSSADYIRQYLLSWRRKMWCPSKSGWTKSENVCRTSEHSNVKKQYAPKYDFTRLAPRFHLFSMWWDFQRHRTGLGTQIWILFSRDFCSWFTQILLKTLPVICYCLCFPLFDLERMPTPKEQNVHGH